MNSAGVQAAIMRDMGFEAEAAAAFCAIYFIVPVLAQHAFMVERTPEPRPRRKVTSSSPPTASAGSRRRASR
jgi:hypothetical protein